MSEDPQEIKPLDDVKVIELKPQQQQQQQQQQQHKSNGRLPKQYVPFPIETLNTEQREAFDAILEGKSIFITGPGGTGKSYLIQAIYNLIPERLGKHVSVTAMTGCAALLLGRYAKTLHSWAGVGLGRGSPAELATAIRRSGWTLKRWLGTDILVIDEVSMLTSDFLEKLNEVAQIVRRDKRPMGGLQVIFVGDFYQLPPVVKADEEGRREIPFVFESPVWKESLGKIITLTQIVRQADPVFQKVLNEARIGEVSESSLEILRSRQGIEWQKELIRPTLLFTRRAEVDIVNDKNLRALTTERKLFAADIVFAPLESLRGVTKETPEIKRAIEKLDKDAPYLVELILAVGAQVMLLSNIDPQQGLVNGSRGVVMGFDSMGTPLVQFRHGQPIPISATTWESEQIEGLSRKQIPLRLAYAITIHKAQGATLDSALIDIGSNTFEYGQAYVALSRVKSLDSLYIWDVEPSAFRAHPKVKQFYNG
jgi:ATP-dependent DNA helicase PIF1